MTKGTNKHIYKLLKKLKKAVNRQKIKLEEQLTKIENLMAASEFVHVELQNLFKEIKEAIDSPMIEKNSVDFLEPYLTLVEQQNVV
jgi:iron-sulfur cluster repair protein YtfE (RIC family)